MSRSSNDTPAQHTRDGRASARDGSGRRHTYRIAADDEERSRRRTRRAIERAAVRPHAVTPRSWGLDARRWRIWRNGTLTGDVNVGGSRVIGGNRRLNRTRRLGEESGDADQVRQDSGSGTVRGPHRARLWLACRFVVHRAHRAQPMPARALIRRVCRGHPQRDGYECDCPDLAEQPDCRERPEHPTQTRHQGNLIPRKRSLSISPSDQIPPSRRAPIRSLRERPSTY